MSVTLSDITIAQLGQLRDCFEATLEGKPLPLSAAKAVLRIGGAGAAGINNTKNNVNMNNSSNTRKSQDVASSANSLLPPLIPQSRNTDGAGGYGNSGASYGIGLDTEEDLEDFRRVVEFYSNDGKLPPPAGPTAAESVSSPLLPNVNNRPSLSSAATPSSPSNNTTTRTQSAAAARANRRSRLASAAPPALDANAMPSFASFPEEANTSSPLQNSPSPGGVGGGGDGNEESFLLSGRGGAEEGSRGFFSSAFGSGPRSRHVTVVRSDTINLNQFSTIWRHVMGPTASSTEMIRLIFEYVDNDDDGLISWPNVFAVVERSRREEAMERLKQSHQRDEVNIRAEEEANTQSERRQAVLRKMNNRGGTTTHTRRSDVEAEEDEEAANNAAASAHSSLAQSEFNFFFPISEEIGAETLSKEAQHNDTIIKMFGTFVPIDPFKAMRSVIATSTNSRPAATSNATSQPRNSLFAQRQMAAEQQQQQQSRQPTFDPIVFAAAVSPVPTPNDVLITFGVDGDVKLWHPSSRELLTTLRHSAHGGVDAYYCNASGLLVVGSCDSSVALYNIRTRKLLRNFVVGRDSDLVFRQQHRAPAVVPDQILMSNGKPPPGPIVKGSVMYRHWRKRQKFMSQRMWAYEKVIDAFKATPLAQIQSVTAVAVRSDASSPKHAFLFLGDETGALWVFRTKAHGNNDESEDHTNGGHDINSTTRDGDRNTTSTRDNSGGTHKTSSSHNRGDDASDDSSDSSSDSDASSNYDDDADELERLLKGGGNASSLPPLDTSKAASAKQRQSNNSSNNNGKHTLDSPSRRRLGKKNRPNKRKADGSFVGFQPLGYYQLHAGAIRQILVLEATALSAAASQGHTTFQNYTSAASPSSSSHSPPHYHSSAASDAFSPFSSHSQQQSRDAGGGDGSSSSLPKKTARELYMAALGKLRAVTASSDSDVHIVSPDTGVVLKTLRGSRTWTLRTHARGVKGFAWNDKELMRTILPEPEEADSTTTTTTSATGGGGGGASPSAAATSASNAQKFNMTPVRNLPMIATWGAERHVILWDPATGRAVDAIYATSRITSACFVAPPYRPSMESSAATQQSQLASDVNNTASSANKNANAPSSSGGGQQDTGGNSSSLNTQQLLLLVLTEDRMVRLWDTQTLSCLQQMRDYSVFSAAGAVFYDPLRENAYSCTARINLWRSVRDKNGNAGGGGAGGRGGAQTHSQPVTHQHHWAKEKILVSSDALSLRLWNTDTGAVLSAWPTKQVHGFAADDAGAFTLVQAAEPSTVSADAVFRAQHEAHYRQLRRKRGGFINNNDKKGDDDDESLSPKFATSGGGGAASSCLQVLDSNRGQVVEVLVGSSRDSSICDIQFLHYKGRWITSSSEHLLVYNTETRENANGPEEVVTPFGDAEGTVEAPIMNSKNSCGAGDSSDVMVAQTKASIAKMRTANAVNSLIKNKQKAGVVGAMTTSSTGEKKDPKHAVFKMIEGKAPEDEGGSVSRVVSGGGGGGGGGGASSSLDANALANALYKFRWPVMRRSLKHVSHVACLAMCEDYVVMGHQTGDVSCVAFTNVPRFGTLPYLKRLSKGVTLWHLMASVASVRTGGGGTAALNGLSKGGLLLSPRNKKTSGSSPLPVSRKSAAANASIAAAQHQKPVVLSSCADVGRVNCCEYVSVLLGPVHKEARPLIKKLMLRQQRLQVVQRREQEMQKQRAEVMRAVTVNPAFGQSATAEETAAANAATPSTSTAESSNNSNTDSSNGSSDPLNAETAATRLAKAAAEHPVPAGIAFATMGGGGILFSDDGAGGGASDPLSVFDGSAGDESGKKEKKHGGSNTTKGASDPSADAAAIPKQTCRIEFMTALHEGSFVVTADSDAVLSLWNLTPHGVEVIRWLPTFGPSTTITALTTMPLPLGPVARSKFQELDPATAAEQKRQTASNCTTSGPVSTIFYADDEGYVGAFEISTDGVTEVLSTIAKQQSELLAQEKAAQRAKLLYQQQVERVRRAGVTGRGGAPSMMASSKNLSQKRGTTAIAEDFAASFVRSRTADPWIGGEGSSPQQPRKSIAARGEFDRKSVRGSLLGRSRSATTAQASPFPGAFLVQPTGAALNSKLSQSTALQPDPISLCIVRTMVCRLPTNRGVLHVGLTAAASNAAAQSTSTTSGGAAQNDAEAVGGIGLTVPNLDGDGPSDSAVAGVSNRFVTSFAWIAQKEVWACGTNTGEIVMLTLQGFIVASLGRTLMPHKLPVRQPPIITDEGTANTATLEGRSLSFYRRSGSVVAAAGASSASLFSSGRPASSSSPRGVSSAGLSKGKRVGPAAPQQPTAASSCEPACVSFSYTHQILLDMYRKEYLMALGEQLGSATMAELRHVLGAALCFKAPPPLPQTQQTHQGFNNNNNAPRLSLTVSSPETPQNVKMFDVNAFGPSVTEEVVSDAPPPLSHPAAVKGGGGISRRQSFLHTAIANISRKESITQQQYDRRMTLSGGINPFASSKQIGSTAVITHALVEAARWRLLSLFSNLDAIYVGANRWFNRSTAPVTATRTTTSGSSLNDNGNLVRLLNALDALAATDPKRNGSNNAGSAFGGGGFLSLRQRIATNLVDNRLFQATLRSVIAASAVAMPVQISPNITIHNCHVMDLSDGRYACLEEVSRGYAMGALLERYFKVAPPASKTNAVLGDVGGQDSAASASPLRRKFNSIGRKDTNEAEAGVDIAALQEALDEKHLVALFPLAPAVLPLAVINATTTYSDTLATRDRAFGPLLAGDGLLGYCGGLAAGMGPTVLANHQPGAVAAAIKLGDVGGGQAKQWGGSGGENGGNASAGGVADDTIATRRRLNTHARFLEELFAVAGGGRGSGIGGLGRTLSRIGGSSANTFRRSPSSPLGGGLPSSASPSTAQLNAKLFFDGGVSLVLEDGHRRIVYEVLPECKHFFRRELTTLKTIMFGHQQRSAAGGGGGSSDGGQSNKLNPLFSLNQSAVIPASDELLDRTQHYHSPTGSTNLDSTKAFMTIAELIESDSDDNAEEKDVTAASVPLEVAACQRITNAESSARSEVIQHESRQFVAIANLVEDVKRLMAKGILDRYLYSPYLHKEMLYASPMIRADAIGIFTSSGPSSSADQNDKKTIHANDNEGLLFRRVEAHTIPPFVSNYLYVKKVRLEKQMAVSATASESRSKAQTELEFLSRFLGVAASSSSSSHTNTTNRHVSAVPLLAPTLPAVQRAARSHRSSTSSSATTHTSPVLDEAARLFGRTKSAHGCRSPSFERMRRRANLKRSASLPHHLRTLMTPASGDATSVSSASTPASMASSPLSSVPHAPITADMLWTFMGVSPFIDGQATNDWTGKWVAAVQQVDAAYRLTSKVGPVVRTNNGSNSGHSAGNGHSTGGGGGGGSTGASNTDSSGDTSQVAGLLSRLMDATSAVAVSYQTDFIASPIDSVTNTHEPPAVQLALAHAKGVAEAFEVRCNTIVTLLTQWRDKACTINLDQTRAEEGQASNNTRKPFGAKPAAIVVKEDPSDQKRAAAQQQRLSYASTLSPPPAHGALPDESHRNSRRRSTVNSIDSSSSPSSAMTSVSLYLTQSQATLLGNANPSVLQMAGLSGASTATAPTSDHPLPSDCTIAPHVLQRPCVLTAAKQIKASLAASGPKPLSRFLAFSVHQWVAPEENILITRVTNPDVRWAVRRRDSFSSDHNSSSGFGGAAPALLPNATCYDMIKTAVQNEVKALVTIGDAQRESGADGGTPRIFTPLMAAVEAAGDLYVCSSLVPTRDSRSPFGASSSPTTPPFSFHSAAVSAALSRIALNLRSLHPSLSASNRVRSLIANSVGTQLTVSPNGLLFLCGGFGKLPLYPSEVRANDGSGHFTSPAMRSEVVKGLSLPSYGSEEMGRILVGLGHAETWKAMCTEWAVDTISAKSAKHHSAGRSGTATTSRGGSRTTTPAKPQSGGSKQLVTASQQRPPSSQSAAADKSDLLQASAMAITNTASATALYLMHPHAFRGSCPSAVKRSVERLTTKTLKRIEGVLVPKVAQWLRQREAALIVQHRRAFRTAEAESGGMFAGNSSSGADGGGQQQGGRGARSGSDTLAGSQSLNNGGGAMSGSFFGGAMPSNFGGAPFSNNSPTSPSSNDDSGSLVGEAATEAYLSDRPLLLALCPSLSETMHRHGANLKHLGLLLTLLSHDEDKIMAHRQGMLDIASMHEQHMRHAIEEALKGAHNTNNKFATTAHQHSSHLPPICEVSMYPGSNTAGPALSEGGIGFADHTASWYVVATEIIARSVAAAVREDCMLVNTTAPLSTERTAAFTAKGVLGAQQCLLDVLRRPLQEADAQSLGPTGVFDAVLQYWLLMLFGAKADAVLEQTIESSAMANGSASVNQHSSSPLLSGTSGAAVNPLSTSLSFVGLPSALTRRRSQNNNNAPGAIPHLLSVRFNAAGSTGSDNSLQAHNASPDVGNSPQQKLLGSFSLHQRIPSASRLNTSNSSGTPTGGGAFSSSTTTATGVGLALGAARRRSSALAEKKASLEDKEQRANADTAEGIMKEEVKWWHNVMFQVMERKFPTVRQAMTHSHHHHPSASGKSSGDETRMEANASHSTAEASASRQRSSLPPLLSTKYGELFPDPTFFCESNTLLMKRIISLAGLQETSSYDADSTAKPSENDLLNANASSSVALNVPPPLSSVGVLGAGTLINGIFELRTRFHGQGAPSASFANTLSRPPNWSWNQQSARLAAEKSAVQQVMSLWPTKRASLFTDCTALAALENQASADDLVPDSHKICALTPAQLISHPRASELIFLLHACDAGHVMGALPSAVHVPAMVSLPAAPTRRTTVREGSTAANKSTSFQEGEEKREEALVALPLIQVLRHISLRVGASSDETDTFVYSVALPFGNDFYPTSSLSQKKKDDKIADSKKSLTKSLTQPPQNVMTVLGLIVRQLDVASSSSVAGRSSANTANPMTMLAIALGVQIAQRNDSNGKAAVAVLAARALVDRAAFSHRERSVLTPHNQPHAPAGYGLNPPAPGKSLFSTQSSAARSAAKFVSTMRQKVSICDASSVGSGAAELLVSSSANDGWNPPAISPSSWDHYMPTMPALDVLPTALGILFNATVSADPQVAPNSLTDEELGISGLPAMSRRLASPRKFNEAADPSEVKSEDFGSLSILTSRSPTPAPSPISALRTGVRSVSLAPALPTEEEGTPPSPATAVDEGYSAFDFAITGSHALPTAPSFITSSLGRLSSVAVVKQWALALRNTSTLRRALRVGAKGGDCSASSPPNSSAASAALDILKSEAAPLCPSSWVVSLLPTAITAPFLFALLRVAQMYCEVEGDLRAASDILALVAHHLITARDGGGCGLGGSSPTFLSATDVNTLATEIMLLEIRLAATEHGAGVAEFSLKFNSYFRARREGLDQVLFPEHLGTIDSPALALNEAMAEEVENANVVAPTNFSCFLPQNFFAANSETKDEAMPEMQENAYSCTARINEAMPVDADDDDDSADSNLKEDLGGGALPPIDCAMAHLVTNQALMKARMLHLRALLLAATVTMGNAAILCNGRRALPQQPSASSSNPHHQPSLLDLTVDAATHLLTTAMTSLEDALQITEPIVVVTAANINHKVPEPSSPSPAMPNDKKGGEDSPSSRATGGLLKMLPPDLRDTFAAKNETAAFLFHSHNNETTTSVFFFPPEDKNSLLLDPALADDAFVVTNGELTTNTSSSSRQRASPPTAVPPAMADIIDAEKRAALQSLFAPSAAFLANGSWSYCYSTASTIAAGCCSASSSADSFCYPPAHTIASPSLCGAGGQMADANDHFALVRLHSELLHLKARLASLTAAMAVSYHLRRASIRSEEIITMQTLMRSAVSSSTREGKGGGGGFHNNRRIPAHLANLNKSTNTNDAFSSSSFLSEHKARLSSVMNKSPTPRLSIAHALHALETVAVPTQTLLVEFSERFCGPLHPAAGLAMCNVGMLFGEIARMKALSAELDAAEMSQLQVLKDMLNAKGVTASASSSSSSSGLLGSYKPPSSSSSPSRKSPSTATATVSSPKLTSTATKQQQQATTSAYFQRAVHCFSVAGQLLRSACGGSATAPLLADVMAAEALIAASAHVEGFSKLLIVCGQLERLGQPHKLFPPITETDAGDDGEQPINTSSEAFSEISTNSTTEVGGVPNAAAAARIKSLSGSSKVSATYVTKPAPMTELEKERLSYQRAIAAYERAMHPLNITKKLITTRLLLLMTSARLSLSCAMLRTRADTVANAEAEQRRKELKEAEQRRGGWGEGERDGLASVSSAQRNADDAKKKRFKRNRVGDWLVDDSYQETYDGSGSTIDGGAGAGDAAKLSLGRGIEIPTIIHNHGDVMRTMMVGDSGSTQLKEARRHALQAMEIILTMALASSVRKGAAAVANTSSPSVATASPSSACLSFAAGGHLDFLRLSSYVPAVNGVVLNNGNATDTANAATSSSPQSPTQPTATANTTASSSTTTNSSSTGAAAVPQDIPPEVATVLAFIRLLLALLEHDIILSRAEIDQVAAMGQRMRLLMRWAKIDTDLSNAGTMDLRDRDINLRPVYLLN